MQLATAYIEAAATRTSDGMDLPTWALITVLAVAATTGLSALTLTLRRRRSSSS